MITIRQMTKAELARATEIDVSEADQSLYHWANGRLATVHQEWVRADWDDASWQDNLADWDSYLGLDLILGAFAGESLVGLASLCYRNPDNSAQVVSIHISRPYRRQGIGRQLMQELIRLARAQGAKPLYVLATNSPSAVGFYMNQSFYPIAPGSELAAESKFSDIPMVMDLL